jgi:hypothetical protein
MASRHQQVGASGADRMPTALRQVAAEPTAKAGLEAPKSRSSHTTIRGEFQESHDPIWGLAGAINLADLALAPIGEMDEMACDKVPQFRVVTQRISDKAR